MATDSVTVCDCRVVLSDCSQLKNYYEHSFVSPDGRWKRAFDYITVIAVRDNKVLSVVSGVFMWMVLIFYVYRNCLSAALPGDISSNFMLLVVVMP